MNNAAVWRAASRFGKRLESDARLRWVAQKMEEHIFNVTERADAVQGTAQRELTATSTVLMHNLWILARLP